MSNEDFIKSKLLGEGQFGRVFKAVEHRSQHVVALKFMDKQSILHYNALAQIKREIEIHSHLINKYILRLYGYFFDQSNIVLIMELLTGPLSKQLATLGPFTNTRSATVLHNITSALGYLHEHNIAHRDIKSENVLFHEVEGTQIYKLADFGWSTFTEHKRRMTLCGTKDFLAPELIMQRGYGKGIDIWSLGCMFYELLVGRPPFDEALYLDGTFDHNDFDSRFVKDTIPDVFYHMSSLRQEEEDRKIYEEEQQRLKKKNNNSDNNLTQKNNNNSDNNMTTTTTASSSTPSKSNPKPTTANSHQTPLSNRNRDGRGNGKKNSGLLTTPSSHPQTQIHSPINPI